MMQRAELTTQFATLTLPMILNSKFLISCLKNVELIVTKITMTRTMKMAAVTAIIMEEKNEVIVLSFSKMLLQ